MVNASSQRAILPALLALFVFVHAAVASLHGHQHLQHRSPAAMAAHFEETVNELQKRANNIAITGVPGAVGQRLEIRDLAKDADRWNLYLLGMQRFMAKDKNDRLSYYQVAGVHGRPYITWNNFGNLVNQAGFCPHGQALFGSWHRPYLAVFEQAWYQCVQEVINEFPSSQQQRWRNAANGLHMPYWDWAKAPPAGEASTPTLIRDKTVSVITPSGRQTIDNPLYSYKWGSVPAEMGGLPWNNFPETLRRPVSNPTRSHNNQVADLMNQRRINLRDRVYGIFMSGASWGDISTSSIGVRTNQNGNNPDSFESVHDMVHVTVGGESGGHMYYLDTSSFDPIFWLHHCNIDRLLAMYQVISPNTYVTSQAINRPMAQWNAGEWKNSYTPLKPFTKNTNGDFFTSEDIRNTRVLGYVYPETNGSPSANSVRSAINNLYGPNAANRKRVSYGAATGKYEGRPFREGDYYTVLSIQANKYALEGSYEINCFLGGNSTKNLTEASYDSPNYVGSYGILGMIMKDQKNASYPVITEGCLPLTTALQGKQLSGELKSMTPKAIESYLATNLKCDVNGPGGVKIPVNEVPDLRLYVKTTPVKPASSPEELPSWGKFEVLPEATKYLPGNAGTPKTYPKPVEPPTYPTPGTPSGEHAPYPTSPNSHAPWTQPEQEPGYCKQKITVEYVDESGKFLYAEPQ